MKIMGLTREHVQTDASEAESPLALGKTRTVFSPGPTEGHTLGAASTAVRRRLVPLPCPCRVFQVRQASSAELTGSQSGTG